MSLEEEVILAQEQGAMMRAAGARKELEAEFGAGEREGTLVLTNRRLVFACTDEKEEDLPVAAWKVRFVYSVVEEISQIPNSPPNTFIPLESIASAKGHGGRLTRPSLEVEWEDAAGQHSHVFVEMLTGRRKRNLNDWAQVIENLKSGKQRLLALPQPPSIDTIEGKVMRALADMQEKGVFAIEEAIKSEFKLKMDPDEVQAVCDRLSSQGLVSRYPDPSGDVFYRKLSPLGEDNPSS